MIQFQKDNQLSGNLNTDANVPFQRKSWLAQAQIRARLIDAGAINTRWIGAFVDICNKSWTQFWNDFKIQIELFYQSKYCFPGNNRTCKSKWRIRPCYRKCHRDTEHSLYIHRYLGMSGYQIENLRDTSRCMTPFCWCTCPIRKDPSNIHRYLQSQIQN